MTGQGQSPVEPVLSAHELAVLLLATELGLVVVFLLVVVFHLLRAVYVGGRR